MYIPARIRVALSEPAPPSACLLDPHEIQDPIGVVRALAKPKRVAYKPYSEGSSLLITTTVNMKEVIVL
jgi:hypothetical protein